MSETVVLYYAKPIKPFASVQTTKPNLHWKLNALPKQVESCINNVFLEHLLSRGKHGVHYPFDNHKLNDCRSFGDASMKEFVLAKPAISQTILNHESQFMILACDGLWYVVPLGLNWVW